MTRISRNLNVLIQIYKKTYLFYVLRQISGMAGPISTRFLLAADVIRSKLVDFYFSYSSRSIIAGQHWSRMDEICWLGAFKSSNDIYTKNSEAPNKSGLITKPIV